MANPNLQLLTDAAKLLRPILGELVFLGGCATALLITDKAAADVRPTFDVDAIAPTVQFHCGSSRERRPLITYWRVRMIRLRHIARATKSDRLKLPRSAIRRLRSSGVKFRAACDRPAIVWVSAILL